MTSQRALLIGTTVLSIAAVTGSFVTARAHEPTAPVIQLAEATAWRDGPPRMVSFFPNEFDACGETAAAAGWTRFEPARGYIIRGSNDNAKIGTRVGAPIKDATPTQHAHYYSAVIDFRKNKQLVNRGTTPKIKDAKVTVEGWTIHSSDPKDAEEKAHHQDGMPYVQLEICISKPLSTTYPDTPHTNPDLSIAHTLLPLHAIQWFTGKSCPPGWAVHQPLIGGKGRTIIPLNNTTKAGYAGVVVDLETEDANHDHSFLALDVADPKSKDPHTVAIRVTQDRGSTLANKEVKTGASIFGFIIGTPTVSNGEEMHFARHGVPDVEGATRRAVRTDLGPEQETGDLVPYIHLRPCIKTEVLEVSDAAEEAFGDELEEELPTGMGFFTADLYCPQLDPFFDENDQPITRSAVEAVAVAAGRFMVGLPTAGPGEADPIAPAVFGGKALRMLNASQAENRSNLPHHTHLLNNQFEPKYVFYSSDLINAHSFDTLSSGNRSFTGPTRSSPITFPYVQLRFCRLM